MNWGTKIAIFYTFFALCMIGAVIYTSRQTIHLVSPNYYEEEIAFETRIQEIKHTKDLKTGISIQTDIPGKLAIIFPKELSIKSGTIRFYRPSDAGLDRSFAIDPTQNTHTISVSGWKKGNWNLQIQWTDGVKNYYDERKIEVLL